MSEPAWTWAIDYKANADGVMVESRRIRVAVITEEQWATRERDLLDAVEMAWGIIANAGGGDWTKETSQWQEAAARWRDEHMDAIARHMRARAQAEEGKSAEDDPFVLLRQLRAEIGEERFRAFCEDQR